jgi:hypothetical protein
MTPRITKQVAKALYRPATELEVRQAVNLASCSLPPATMTKRFALQLKDQIIDRKEISDKQAAYLQVCCYRYRRQMSPALVPATPPPGYETSKQKFDKMRYESAMKGQSA